MTSVLGTKTCSNIASRDFQFGVSRFALARFGTHPSPFSALVFARSSSVARSASSFSFARPRLLGFACSFATACSLARLFCFSPLLFSSHPLSPMAMCFCFVCVFSPTILPFAPFLLCFTPALFCAPSHVLVFCRCSYLYLFAFFCSTKTPCPFCDPCCSAKNLLPILWPLLRILMMFLFIRVSLSDFRVSLFFFGS